MNTGAVYFKLSCHRDAPHMETAEVRAEQGGRQPPEGEVGMRWAEPAPPKSKDIYLTFSKCIDNSGNQLPQERAFKAIYQSKIPNIK